MNFNRRSVTQMVAIPVKGVQLDSGFRPFIYEVSIPIKKDGDGYAADLQAFNIYAWAATVGEVEDSINSDLSMLFNNFAFEDDSRLSEDSIRLKRRLLQLIGE